MRSLGFSLIELMVVIAIVGSLAVAAVPIYKSYVEQSKYQAMYPVIDGILDQAREYYADNGTWPIARELDFDTTIDSDGLNLTPENLALINPNLTELIIDTWICSAVSRVGYAFNYDYTSYNDKVSFWYTANIDGITHTTCDDESDSGHELVGVECIDPTYPTPANLAAAAGC